MNLHIVCRENDAVFDASMYDASSMPVGFYQFLKDNLNSLRSLPFVKFELSFCSSVVQGSLFDEPLVDFK